MARFGSGGEILEELIEPRMFDAEQAASEWLDIEAKRRESPRPLGLGFAEGSVVPARATARALPGCRGNRAAG
jgi:hypothetical protein